MRYLSLSHILQLYLRVMEQSGGTIGIRDFGALESALAQPHVTFDQVELCSTLLDKAALDKAAALGHALILNHPFVDGNKRIGQAAMETMLFLNGYEIVAEVSGQERLILAVAEGQVSRIELAQWLERYVRQR
ncbi:MAG: type II toxin-antitoxin system death-on-curing family toxin [Chloroflexi bacterium]|nr:MAG: type II toxin-antitoxin system death-on-curing family toxin [Chloroflexota bacterium]